MSYHEEYKEEYHENLARIGGFILTILGSGLSVVGIIIVLLKIEELDASIFFLLAFICLFSGLIWLYMYFFKIRKQPEHLVWLNFLVFVVLSGLLIIGNLILLGLTV